MHENEWEKALMYVFIAVKHNTQLLFCSGLDKQSIRLQ